MGLLAIIALVVSLTAIRDLVNNRVNAVQTARYHAAVDDCLLLREVIIAATPKSRLDRATALINTTLLRNCGAYGKTIENHP